jgi:hypothetical protein
MRIQLPDELVGVVKIIIVLELESATIFLTYVLSQDQAVEISLKG